MLLLPKVLRLPEVLRSGRTLRGHWSPASLKRIPFRFDWRFIVVSLVWGFTEQALVRRFTGVIGFLVRSFLHRMRGADLRRFRVMRVGD